MKTSLWKPKSKSGKRERKHGFMKRMKENSSLIRDKRRKGRWKIALRNISLI